MGIVWNRFIQIKVWILRKSVTSVLTKTAVTTLMGAMLLALGLTAYAQHEPFVVHDTKPVIMHGPYLSSLSETAATIVWMTDTPCHAKVLFGPKGESMTREAHNAEHGLLPIGTRHVVHLTGLEPGKAYTYKVVATRAVKMKAYWPEKGLAVEGPERMFTTFDRSRLAVSFSAIADTHEDLARVKGLLHAVDWAETDFLVHLGDAFHSLESEDQLFARWLGPAEKAAAGEKLLMFIRGNHEMRGAFARNLMEYVPVPEGRFYYVRDHGPLHFIILDTGEDKADETNVYAELNKVEVYREEEFAWLERHLATDESAAEAPFRVILLHQPHWGWTGEREDKWTELANNEKIDLVIGGYFHRLRIYKPDSRGKDFWMLALEQDQVARVEATLSDLLVTVKGKDGKVLETLAIKARR
ncbi:MAG: metallophosphoesterase family protein [Candidatus Aminicenantes bacterium]|nr:metallophosphoesterase family protein [Candidatus Aminicenantes bacterium]